MIHKSNSVQKIQIPDRTYFKIGDVAELLGVKPYVLRYWESEFSMIKPQKSTSGQRVYRKSDVETVVVIKHLLHEERYSIEGAKKRLKELRKEGEFKDFKAETLSAGAEVAPGTEWGVTSTAGGSVRPQNHEEIKACVHELSELLKIQMTDLFNY